MKFTPKCCCGATADFDTTGQGADMCVRGSVREAYDRWMKQHDGCPALYAKPVPAAPITYHEPKWGHGGIPVGVVHDILGDPTKSVTLEHGTSVLPSDVTPKDSCK